MRSIIIKRQRENSMQTFVSLIPKKLGASELKDFRLISLIIGIYKVLAKILAERLKR